ncbi:Sodium bicarbonate transporter-like protein 11 [Halotydeus destructor]|nr:Sodium bicarbonate transporter-like protein 11 [Halotydeus destructor]
MDRPDTDGPDMELVNLTQTSGHGVVNMAFDELRDRAQSEMTESSFMFSKTDDFPKVLSQMEAGAGSGFLYPNLVDIDLGQGDGQQDGGIMVTSTVKLEPADFSAEIRPKMDASRFIANLTVSLDVHQASLTTIVDQLVRAMVTGREADIVSHEICETLYTDDKKTTFAETIQGVVPSNDPDGPIFDNSWVVALCSAPSLKQRRTGIARLVFPVNFGPRLEAVRFIVVVATPSEIKPTKSAIETGRTLATILSHRETRLNLMAAQNRTTFITVLQDSAKSLATVSKSNLLPSPPEEPLCQFMGGLQENITRRLRYYGSDFLDGIQDMRSIQKTLSTTLFIYFSVIFPCIAFGALNATNTNSKSDANRALLGQAVGGLAWAFFAGQPMIIIATTALVSLYSKVVYEMALVLDEDFYTVYAWCGLWSTLFTVIYSVFGLSNLIKFSTRCVEEIFASFIVICFFTDAIRGLVGSFMSNYFTEACYQTVSDNISNNSYTYLDLVDSSADLGGCHRDAAILGLILMLGTLWLSLTIFEFKDSAYLTPGIRELLSEYALPLGVIVFSFVGMTAFSQVASETFQVSEQIEFKMANLTTSWKVIGSTAGMGFALSLLFFMDQNITGQIVNSPVNRMVKGEAKHLDMLWIAIVNCFMSIFGLPWMHGILPQSPLHVVCMADSQEILDNGHVRLVITRVRETRLTGILAHVLIALTVVFFPWTLSTVPKSVLDGLFLYCAVSALRGNSFWERLQLLITEQTQYPANHYVRKCPQKSMHIFTVSQLFQLAILSFIGYAPWTYVQMAFPVFIAILIPIRHWFMPLVVNRAYLRALDAFE